MNYKHLILSRALFKKVIDCHFWPSPHLFRFNHRSALSESTFVASAIDDLLARGCIVQSGECALVCT